MIIVSDTTAISNLFQIDRMELLRQLYKNVLIPPAVAEELHQMKRSKINISDFSWIKVTEPKDENLLLEISKRLDPGETQAIVLAIEHQPYYLVMDEIRGRKVAKEYELPIIGTLGILLESKEKGFIKSVREEIDKLHSIGFWMNKALLERVLKQANEL